jgi:hypothetical protein
VPDRTESQCDGDSRDRSGSDGSCVLVWTGGGEDEDGVLRAPALLKHRVRVVRKILPSIVALHKDLLEAIPADSDIELPECPDAFLLGAFEAKYLAHHFAVFSALGQAADVRALTREATRHIRDYLTSVLVRFVNLNTCWMLLLVWSVWGDGPKLSQVA